MVVYLDMCCLKRPFDDQSQPRIRLESEAVLAVMGAESPQLRMIRSPALLLENSQNPVASRAARVDAWLRSGVVEEADTEFAARRSAELMSLGFKNFDALHIASAERAGADVLATCDDRLLATGKRQAHNIKVRVISMVELAEEVLK